MRSAGAADRFYRRDLAVAAEGRQHLQPLVAGAGAVPVESPLLQAGLVGAGHLLFAGQEGLPPEAAAVRKMVNTVIAGVVREPLP